MPVRRGPAGLLRQAEGWILEPGSARSLAALRIGLCLLLAVRLSRSVYVQLAGQPSVLFRPLSFMRLLQAMPSREVVLTIQALAIAASLMAAGGVAARISLPVAWLGAVFLNGMWTSVGQPMHNETLLLLAMVPLLRAPSTDAWSLAAVGRGRTSGRSVRYGWPVRTSMIVVAGGYFFSGFNKLVFSGPAWVFSDNLRWILYGISDQNRRPIAAALLLASHPLAAHAVAGLSLATEIGFPIVLWKPRLVGIFVPAAVLLHVGIGITMHLDYSAWAATAVVLFVRWEALADRLARRRKAGAALVGPGLAHGSGLP